MIFGEEARAMGYEQPPEIIGASALDLARGAGSLVGAGSALLPALVGRDFAFAALWVVDRASGVLRCRAVWPDDERLDPFRRATLESVLGPGVDLPGTAWLRREPVGVPELSDDPSFTRGSQAAATGLVSGVAVPLRSGGRVAAVIEGYRHEAAVPAPAVAGRVAARLDALAALLASGALPVGPPERARATDEAVRAARLASVAELGRRALSGTACEQIAVEAVELAAAALNADQAAFLELDEDGEHFVVRAGLGWAPGVVGSAVPGAHGSLAGYTLIADAPVVVDDLRAETRFRPPAVLLEHGIVSGVSAVVRVAEQPLGIVSVLSGDRRRFHADEIEFLRLVANTLAAAIARSRADAAVQRSDALLHAIVDGTTDVVYVRDLEGRYLMINAAGARLLGRPRDEIAGLHVEDVFPADVAREIRRVDDTVVAGGRWRTYEEPIVSGAGEARVFLSTTGPYLAPDGAPVGLIGIAHDITERKRAEDRQRLVGAVGRVLAAGHDEQGAVGEVASLAVPAMADWCVIELLDPAGRIVPVAATHAGDKGRLLDELRRRHSHDRGSAANVVRSARPELYQHVDGAADGGRGAHLDLLQRVGYESAVVVPLVSRGQWIGAITLAVTRRRRYSWEDLAVFEQLADRLALALDNARLAHERTRTAEALRACVLPGELPSFPGLELAARLRTADDAGELGGGAYDAFAVEGGAVLMIGDVRARGPEAAAMIMRAGRVVRSAAERDASPAALLRALNAALLCKPDDAPFCTAAIARLRLSDDRAEVAVACAAHPAPLVLRASGAVAALPASGGALGVAPDVELEPARLTLDPGDALVLFTAPAYGAGTAQLDEALGAWRGAGADELARRIEARTLDARLDEIDEDLVILVARLAP